MRSMIGSKVRADYERDLKVVRSYNELQLMIGGEVFLKTYFRGEDGVYYDAIGDEIFLVQRIGGTDAKPEYVFTFGNRESCGLLVDHGFNYCLSGLGGEEKILIRGDQIQVLDYIPPKKDPPRGKPKSLKAWERRMRK